jgi:hypothetical protein
MFVLTSFRGNQPPKRRKTMSTAAINQPTRPRREMIEVKAPELFQFTKPGQVLEGCLRRIEPTIVKGKEAIEYLFENEDGMRVTCLGTADLNKKLNPNHIGHWLEIRYERDDDSFQKAGQSAMKIFKLLVSKDKEIA